MEFVKFGSDLNCNNLSFNEINKVIYDWYSKQLNNKHSILDRLYENNSRLGTRNHLIVIYDEDFKLSSIIWNKLCQILIW